MISKTRTRLIHRPNIHHGTGKIKLNYEFIRVQFLKRTQIHMINHEQKIILLEQ